MKKLQFKWEWCPDCEIWMVICPKCGNNCCNGSYGPIIATEDVRHTCEVCPLVYQYQNAVARYCDLDNKKVKP